MPFLNAAFYGQRSSVLGFLRLTVLCLISFHAAFAAETVETDGRIGGAPIDPTLAITQFRVPDGFKIDLFAAEPQLANPVSFCFDEQGRVYVAETFRYKTSVLDIRDYISMYYDDLASRTVGDRANVLKTYFGDRAERLGVESEVIRMLQDTNGSGHANSSIVYAEGFNTILDGIGAGVLARKGQVYYTDIPNLWLLSGTNAAGQATNRTSLSYGYGVHFGYTGHDLHGLRIGPDGKIYFSSGDRGLNVTTHEGKKLEYPDMGSVLRCNLDGSDLEMFAYGLRNPQELAFDDYGNLFTGDNNCDYGDAARIVYIAEGGDSGWRTANQYSETTPAGVWNTEKLWHLQFPGQAAYILPPIAHLGNGPSGIAHYPGTGFSEAYADHFFLADFRGASANSGIHSFAFKPSGASYELIDHTNFFWHILATDVDFSPDGRMYVSDWVRGWPQSQLGRLYRVYNPDRVMTPLVLETKKLISEGMTLRPETELETLLAHADQRVRQEAQFELVDRAKTNNASPALEVLTRTTLQSTNLLARLHGIWGAGQLGRIHAETMTALLPLLNDSQVEVRAQTAKVLGEGNFKRGSNTKTEAYAGLVKALTNASPRVQYFAALSLGKLGIPEAVVPLMALIRENQDKDVFIRHAAVMGLLGTAPQAALMKATSADSSSVRMATLLVMRRREMPEITNFLHDADPLIVLEAARAINDLPIQAALPALASLIAKPTGVEMLDWRIINANVRVGTPQTAAALARYAVDTNAPEKLRSEAVRGLSGWAKPFPRDRLTGLWRPLPPHDINVAVTVLNPVINQLAGPGPELLRDSVIRAIEDLDLTNAIPSLRAAVHESQTSANVRVRALKALARLHDPQLPVVVAFALKESDENLRREANRLQAELNPGEAAASFATILDYGTTIEKQGALNALATTPGEAANNLLGLWLDKLMTGKVPREIQLDLLLAAEKRDTPLMRQKLASQAARQSPDDEFKGFRETLYGGDAAAGKKIFIERQDASCVRCHKYNHEGGEVGPELTGIGSRHDREYILESILYPNKQIAPGYDSLIVQTKNGQAYAGVLKGQTDTELKIFSVEDNALVTVKKSDITSQIKGQSAMVEGLGQVLSREDLRNLVEFLASSK